MAEYKEHKVDSGLIATPANEVCGSPKDFEGEGVTHGGCEFDTPGVGEHKETGGVFEMVTFVEDLHRGKADIEVEGPTK
jgi:hypothetical protein